MPALSSVMGLHSADQLLSQSHHCLSYRGPGVLTSLLSGEMGLMFSSHLSLEAYKVTRHLIPQPHASSRIAPCAEQGLISLTVTSSKSMSSGKDLPAVGMPKASEGSFPPSCSFFVPIHERQSNWEWELGSSEGKKYLVMRHLGLRENCGLLSRLQMSIHSGMDQKCVCF